MKGTCKDCTANMDPPKLVVQIHDIDSGYNVGYYCKYECAIAEIPAVLNTLAETGDVAELPDAFTTIREPILEIVPKVWTPGTAIEVGLKGQTPPYNTRMYSMAEKLAKDLYDNLNIALSHWAMQDVGYGWDWTKDQNEMKTLTTALGYEIPYRHRVVKFLNHDFSYEISYDDALVYLKFPKVPDFNLTFQPDQFKMGRAMEMVISQIRMLALKSERLIIPTPPETPDAQGITFTQASVTMPSDMVQPVESVPSPMAAPMQAENLTS